ncbi:MAG: regulator [Methanomicrobia archaeon]|nr:regulator [Methanomicrobia archaeon]RLF93590.1 MAG: regulator [Thermococci archaeon]RLF96940.1 MAG: regulator [Thermococci archaeon]HDN81876.1 regulator [Methanomicrobia archaeon]
MWNKVERYFDNLPIRKKVAALFLTYGLSIKEDEKIYCNEVEVSYTSIARAVGVDRRVVKETVRMILRNEELSTVFKNLSSVAFYNEVAKRMHFGVVEIYAEASTVGIVAKISTMIAQENISIRQIVADDPTLFPEPKLTIITGKKVPGELLDQFLSVKGVKRVSIY